MFLSDEDSDIIIPFLVSMPGLHADVKSNNLSADSSEYSSVRKFIKLSALFLSCAI